MSNKIVPKICGTNEAYLPQAGCSDCDELETRVAHLEECCNEVKDELQTELPKKLEKGNLHAGNLITLTTSGNDITVAVDGIDPNNYYSKTEIDTMIDGLEGIEFVHVDVLPAEGEPNKIYFVPSAPGSDDCDEYIWLNNRWELIGHTSIDMSDYYNKTEVDNLLDDKQDALTAGEYIDISNNVVSLDLTKDDILAILGYEEAEISMLGEDNSVVTATVLMKSDASA